MGTPFEKLQVVAVMTREIRKISAERPAMEALEVMQSGSLSSVLVSSKGQVLGIITERDVVRAMNSHTQLDALTCADLMSTPVITVTLTTSCMDAYHLMATRGIRHLAVTTPRGHVLGIVSEGDLMRNFGHEYYMTFKTVGGVMARDCCRLPAQSAVADALALMVEKHQSCVVVTGDDGGAAGVLTERDVVRLCSQHQDAARLTLAQVMRGPAITARPQMRLHDAVRMMEQSHVRRLVVVDETDRVCGLLTHHEVARGLETDYADYLKSVVELQAHEMVRGARAIDEKLLLANILRSVSGTSVLASDMDHRISYASSTDQLGLDGQALAGTDIREALRGMGWTDASAAFAEVAITQMAKHHVVGTPRGKVDLQLSMLFDGNDRPQGYLVLGQKVR